MSKVWFCMILPSLVFLLFKNPNAILQEMLSASKSTVELCINLLGIYAVWLGILEIVDKSGLGQKLEKLLSPIIKFLFKSKDPETNKYIAINMASNILGLGNAATPSGIKAMQKLDDGSGKASFSAIMLLVINSVSFQLLPTTIIGLRESAGSSNSSDIILPIIISSILTCIFAVSLVFLFNLLKRKKKQ